MLRLISALALCAASSAALAGNDVKPADALVSSAAWWEKLVVTVGSGETQCLYHSSLAPGASQACDVEGEAMAKAGPSEAGKATEITFERRFTPGPVPDGGAVSAGDTLLGKSVIALAIAADGRVRGCKLIGRSGDMVPDYGCEEAKAERFQTAVAQSREPQRIATMTILVYAHEEHYT